MKKIRFITLSQAQAEDLFSNDNLLKNNKDSKIVLISITGPVEPLANIKANVPILRLQFDDVDKHDSSGIYPYPVFAFTREHAYQIFDFVNKEEPDIIITHCKAGVCRSAAVNAALSKIMLEKDDKFFQEGVPNMLVYTTMLNTWFVDLIQYSEQHKEMSCAHLYPFIYKTRTKHFKKIH